MSKHDPVADLTPDPSETLKEPKWDDVGELQSMLDDLESGGTATGCHCEECRQSHALSAALEALTKAQAWDEFRLWTGEQLARCDSRFCVPCLDALRVKMDTLAPLPTPEAER